MNPQNTVVIYSSEVTEVNASFEIGSAIYNPQIVMMNNFNGDTVYAELERKIKANEDLTDTDLVNLILLPLMKHNISKNELAVKSIRLAQTIEDKTKRDICIASVVVVANMIGYLRHGVTTYIVRKM